MRRSLGAAKDTRFVIVARLGIWVGDADKIATGGFRALSRSGAVVVFRWPTDVIAAGYTNTARPRHFLRMESGDFPKRLLRTYVKLKHQAAKIVVRLIEVRALHAHLVWGHIAGRTADDLVISLLPNALSIKPGKPYNRAHVEKLIADVMEARHLGEPKE